MFCVQIDNKAVQNFPCFVCWCSASRNSGLEYYGYKLFETEKQTLEETAQLLGKLRLFTAYSGTADNASNCSTSKKISGRITDAISRVQTAGLAFGGTSVCSYRVRGVDGRCADHLSVESYTVLLVFHHPLTLSFQA